MRRNHVRIERELAQNIASVCAKSRDSCGYTAVQRSRIFCYPRIIGVKSLAMRVGGKLRCVVRGGKDFSDFIERVGCLEEPSCCVRIHQSRFWPSDD